MPEESNRWCRRDTAPVNISSCPGNNTSNCQSYNYRDVLEEWRAEEFGEDNGDERQEADADELWRTPSIVYTPSNDVTSEKYIEKREMRRTEEVEGRRY